jgi:hypothetical protein
MLFVVPFALLSYVWKEQEKILKEIKFATYAEGFKMFTGLGNII